MKSRVGRCTFVAQLLGISLAAIVLQPTVSAACLATKIVESINVPNSPWVIVTKVWPCLADRRVAMEIVAVNSTTKNREIIAYFGEDADVDLTAISSSKIIIKLPNRSHIIFSRDRFSGGVVEYKFLPEDDAADRALYTLWMENPKDPRSREWYDNNIKGKANPQLGLPK
jgi:hypothetical protein